MATLLCDQNLNYWYSELNWNHAPTGLIAQRSKWEYLGSSGFAPNRETHNRRKQIFAQFGDMVPTYPNEYSEIGT